MGRQEIDSFVIPQKVRKKQLDSNQNWREK
jgi:hypothetical protein